MDDKRVLWSDAERLAEEALRQLGVVGQTILQADVQHGQVTPEGQGGQVTYQVFIETKETKN